MTDQANWITIEQAAVTLGLSVRTVNRHMAAGKLQSRLNGEGRREVLVSVRFHDPTTFCARTRDCSVGLR